MKALILARYDRQGASSRLRTMQYVPYLQAAGLDVEVLSLFDHAYLAARYAGTRPPGSTLQAYASRLRQRPRLREADVIWLEYEAFPMLPWWLERHFLLTATPVVSDFDDPVFHRYDMHRSRIARTLLRTKIDEVMRHSALVFAGNAYLERRARAAGARAVELVPTVVDVEAYGHRPRPSPDGKLRVGWIGTPETWGAFVAPMLPVFATLMAEHDAVFRAVGADPSEVPSKRFEVLGWSEDSEAVSVQGMDVGIMPLPDTPWTQGKCGYKLLQYMACGLPVVASPVGANKEIVEHGVNGLIAETAEEWRQALSALLHDATLRHKLGQAGLETVRRRYSLQAQGPRVAQRLRTVARENHRGR